MLITWVHTGTPLAETAVWSHGAHGYSTSKYPYLIAWVHMSTHQNIPVLTTWTHMSSPFGGYRV